LNPSCLASADGFLPLAEVIFPEQRMATEQPTELEDIDGFFLRGELDESGAVLADRPVGLLLDEDVDTVAPPSAAQLARRARMRKLVVAIVAPLGVTSAVLLGPRALSLRAGAGCQASRDVPHASAPVAVDRVASAHSFAPAPVASERTTDQPKLAEPPAIAVEAAPPPTAAPKAARVARAAPREMRPALTRSSLPSDTARSTQASVTPSQSTGASDSLPTARFPSSAAN
jgi:hypothetical protein